jgi:hypothetical protein
VQKRVINANSLKAYIRVVGTIVTGPVLVGATCFYQADAA